MTTYKFKNRHKDKILAMSLASVILLSSLGLTQMVYAHPNYSGQKWSGTSTSMCYNTNLNNLWLNGGTNNLSGVTTVLNNARSAWNSLPSVWTLNFNSNSNCANSNSAGTMSATYNAITTTVKTNNVITEADTVYNSNQFWSSTNCVDPYKSLSIVSKHEFGHWVRFLEDNQSPTHSIMYGYHDCLAGTITTADSNELTSIYG